MPTSVKATRKKVTRQSREVRIHEILTSAREVFEARGYEKATVAEIASRAGIVEGTVFSYFPSKRVLVLKVMEQFYQQITQRIEEGIQGVKGTRERFYFVTWNHLNIMTQNRALCGVILNESRGVDQELSPQVRALNRRYTEVVTKITKEGIARGELRPDISITLVRNTLFGTLEHYLWGIYLDSKTTETPLLDIHQTSQQITQLIFDGISNNHQTLEDNSVKSEVSELIQKLNAPL
ncbi:TetR/AcrR family transcriptional regulator [Endozoicomonas sp.]|uniref:TetR/AcrR family transcriptional regulator n=1 Tax=Endozoicomonas sp. TaxID=1892382 RepID=UPI002885902C|nr:TetR/AcrR family transcriptional regulator [Endozoicomonas sp.]